MGASWLVALLLVAGEVRKETWEDGTPRAEYEVVVQRGRELKDGPYRSWHANGTLASEGRYEKDLPVGRWKLYHEDGALAEEGSYVRGERQAAWETFHPGGKRASKGRYEQGRRVQQWSFWQEDGKPDESRSGVYEPVDLRLADGRTLSGERLDLRLHGAWRGHWADGQVLFTGSFVRGRREGNWLFFLPDGSASSSLSLHYSADVASGPAALSVPAAAGAPLSIAAGALGPPPDAEGLERDLDAVLAARTAQDLEGVLKKSRWAAAGTQALPLVLRRLVAQDAESVPGRAAIGRLEASVLRMLCHGHVLLPGQPEVPPGAEAARELQRTWAALWAATSSDVWFWRVELPITPTDDPWFLRERPARALLTALATPTPPPVYARRGVGKDDPVRASVAEALVWLARNQRPDGSWSSSLGLPSESDVFDEGVTALALLALMGAGEAPDSPPVANGLGYLIVRQGPVNGLIPGVMRSHDWMYMHCLATLALAEAQSLRPSPMLRERLALAVEVIFAARNPGGGWRYDSPPNGESDTSITAWAVSALFAARTAGIEGEYQAAFDSVLAWIETLTEPVTGRIGYMQAGELSARTTENESFPREKGEALTGAGLFVRRMLGVPLADPFVKKQLALLEALPPLWDPEGGAVDEYYVFYAAHALALCGPEAGVRWRKGLQEYVRAQEKTSEQRGSWPPVGVWAYCGGRVYSTAMLTLALTAPYRLTLPETDPKSKPKGKK